MTAVDQTMCFQLQALVDSCQKSKTNYVCVPKNLSEKGRSFRTNPRFRWLVSFIKVKTLAISTFSPVSSLSSNGMRMCVCVCVCLSE